MSSRADFPAVSFINLQICYQFTLSFVNLELIHIHLAQGNMKKINPFVCNTVLQTLNFILPHLADSSC